MQDLRVGLVGCGGIGAVHARSWGEVPGAGIAAACDADRERAAGVSPAAFADWREMLEAVPLDVVDVCTPPNLHADVAIAALQRGIPVICEKPLARTAEEARAIVDAARQSGVLLMTAFCHRFHPPIQAARALQEEGVLGRVLMFRNRFGTRFAGVEDRWFSRPEISGGGVLLDTSIHSIDLFRFLVGEVARSTAAVRSFHPAIQEAEDSGVLLLEAESGALGVIEASWMTPWSANVVEVYGEKGALVVDYDTGEARYRLDGDEAWRPIPAEGPSRFVTELVHFTAAVRGETPLLVTGEDGLRAVEIVQGAVAAARSR